jgi:hypothetical protein
VIALLFGWIAVGMEIGCRIAKLFNVEWAPAVSAGIGTFVLFFVLGGLGELIPCVGLLPLIFVGAWGLGAVVITRFGTQDYIPTGGTTGTTTAADADLPEVVIPQLEVSDEPETVVAPVVEVESEPDDEPGSDDDSDEPATPQSDD